MGSSNRNRVCGGSRCFVFDSTPADKITNLSMLFPINENAGNCQFHCSEEYPSGRYLSPLWNSGIATCIRVQVARYRGTPHAQSHVFLRVPSTSLPFFLCQSPPLHLATGFGSRGNTDSPENTEKEHKGRKEEKKTYQCSTILYHSLLCVGPCRFRSSLPCLSPCCPHVVLFCV